MTHQHMIWKELWIHHSQSPVLPLAGADRSGGADRKLQALVCESSHREVSGEIESVCRQWKGQMSDRQDGCVVSWQCSKANQVTATFDTPAGITGSPSQEKKQTTSELPAAALGRSRHTSGSEGSFCVKGTKKR